MTVKHPYQPPTYGVRSLAIERRLAGRPPASVEAEEPEEKAELEPPNKAEPAPANKAKPAPANKSKGKK